MDKTHHDHRFQSMNEVIVRLTPGIPIVVLVLVTQGKLTRKLLLNLFIGKGLTISLREGRREGGRERGREREREGGRDGGREGGIERGEN